MWSRLRGAVARIPRPEAADLIGLGGYAAIVHGTALLSAPIAWILGGAIAFVAGLLLSREARR